MMKKEPHVLDIKKDKNYAWCQCNESEGQPFCDGSHAKTEHQPIVLNICQRKVATQIIPNGPFFPQKNDVVANKCT